jgi:hypothetical protein
MVTLAWQPNWAFHTRKSLEWGIKLGVTDCVEWSSVGKEASHAKTPIRGISRQDAKTPRFVGLGTR